MRCVISDQTQDNSSEYYVHNLNLVLPKMNDLEQRRGHSDKANGNKSMLQ